MSVKQYEKQVDGTFVLKCELSTKDETNKKQDKLTSTTKLCSINGQSINYGGSYTISGGGGSTETITSAWCINQHVSSANSVWVGDVLNNPENLVIKIQALYDNCTININCSSAQLENSTTINMNEEFTIAIYYELFPNDQDSNTFHIIVRHSSSSGWTEMGNPASTSLQYPEITATGPHIVTYYREE